MKRAPLLVKVLRKSRGVTSSEGEQLAIGTVLNDVGGKPRHVARIAEFTFKIHESVMSTDWPFHQATSSSTCASAPSASSAMAPTSWRRIAARQARCKP